MVKCIQKSSCLNINKTEKYLPDKSFSPSNNNNKLTPSCLITIINVHPQTKASLSILVYEKTIMPFDLSKPFLANLRKKVIIWEYWQN